MVLKTGFEAMKSGDSVDYQRFYQQQSDVCMLRLFDSFAESAPQLVFHLYVMILKSYWPIEQVRLKLQGRDSGGFWLNLVHNPQIAKADRTSKIDTD